MLISPDSLRPQTSKVPALFRLGFRPFFLLASVYAVVAMLNWSGVYAHWWPTPVASLSPTLWHAHEMVFGFGMAVAAGFILTAAKNWTGLHTASGWRLALLVALWLVARIGANLQLPYSPWLTFSADLLFALLLIYETAYPVIKTRQWMHLGIVAKLALIGLSNVLFMYGWLQQDTTLQSIGVYSGLYLLIGLIVTMGRRVIPFFIERGIPGLAPLQNPVWLDRLALALFFAFYLLEVFTTRESLASAFAGLLALLYLLRLYHWHERRIWTRPLLWSLYLSQVFIALGFALLALRPWAATLAMPALHALSYGAIGLVTLGMMARVAWGHTGRNIQQPPAGLHLVFGMIGVGALLRVFLPLLLPAHYGLWILLSQILWIVAFGGFTALYFRVLMQPRIDGQFG